MDDVHGDGEGHKVQVPELGLGFSVWKGVLGV